MPLTVPTHPVAVLPLKLWLPRWFDGVALVVGSTAPDLAYALDGSGLPVWPLSHEVPGLVAWCLPVTLVGAWLVRRAAPGIARHLPALPEPGAAHRWPVTVGSALVGAASHLALDRLEAGAPVAEYVMHVLGAVLCAVAAGLIAASFAVGSPRG